MMHISLIYNSLLWETDANAYSKGVFSPLSAREEIRFSGDRLILPGGWRVKTQFGAYEEAVSFVKEGNHTLENGNERAYLMLRKYEPASLKSVLLLPKARFTVGRASTNDISFRDGFLSSDHGVFSYDRSGTLYYEDISSNGTFIDGKLLHKDTCVLKKGDRLTFPALMEITVLDCALSVRYLKEQTKISLLSFDEYEEKCRVCLMFQTSGNLHHLWMERTVTDVREFISVCYSRMNHADAVHLQRDCGLLNLKTGLPVTTSGDLKKMLEEDNAFVLVS